MQSISLLFTILPEYLEMKTKYITSDALNFIPNSINGHFFGRLHENLSQKLGSEDHFEVLKVSIAKLDQ